MKLTVSNLGPMPLHMEEALHTYLTVGDARQVSIRGLAGTEFLDKTDGFQRKRQTEPVLTLTGETDRPYLHTEQTVTLDDPVFAAKPLRRQNKLEDNGRLEPVVGALRQARGHEPGWLGADDLH